MSDVVVSETAPAEIIEVVAAGPQGPVGDVNPQMPVILAATEAARDAALVSELSAAASQSAAATSAANAATSESNAATSAATATAQATASADSATASAGSAAAAQASATNAANSATDAANSATASANSATNSANSATAAQAAQTATESARDTTLATIGTAALKANNLSDLDSIPTALANLHLNNVSNTSDADKPISTATQNALDGKVDTSSLSASSGSSLVGYLPAGTGAVATDVQSKLRESVSVKDFGAVGDWNGSTGANDTAAVQAFFTHLAANGGVGYIPPGNYKITAGIVLINPAKGFVVFGAGDESCIQLRASSNVTALSIVAPHGTVMENFLIDCGYSVTGFASHGYSFSDPNAVTMRGVNVIDHRTSAGLMFLQAATAIATSQNVNGDYRNCYILDSYSDSKGNGQNGFLLECMYASAIINCHVAPLDRAGTPSVGLQLKNECRYSHIIGGSAEGCLAGAAFGGDGGVAGSAAYHCSIRGTAVKDSFDGVIIGKSTDCYVDVIVDMSDNASNQYAVNVAGFNVGLKTDVSVSNIPAGKYVARVGSDNTSITMSLPDGIGSGKLALLEAGVDFTVIEVDRIAGISGATSMLPYVTDNSASSTNYIYYKLGLGAGGLSNNASYYFQTTGGGQSYISYSGSSKTMNWRLDGADHLSLISSWLSPVTDNLKSLGRATQRWSVVYAGTGTINTSDEREKQDIASLNDAESRVAVRLKGLVKKYRFKDSVKQKGNDARVHVGVIAQEVATAFAAEGLDAGRYGILCYDEWQDEFDEAGNLRTSAGNRYGVRYEELFAFIIGAL